MADTTTGGGTFFEKYGTAIALLLGLVIIAGAIMYGRPGTPAPSEGTPTAVDINDVKTEGSPYVGNRNAPVTVAVWFDFQCGFCKQYESTTLKSVTEEFVNDGKVRIVYKDYQFLGQASIDTALYSRAVWDAYPDKWGAWFTAVATGSTGEVTLNAAGLDAVSVGLGLDATRINKLLTDNKAKYQAAITADQAEGVAFGIKGTPGSIIGTTLVSGAQPYTPTGRPNEQPVKPLIEAELAN